MENLRPSKATNLEVLYNQLGVSERLKEVIPPYRGLDFAIMDLGESLAIVLKEEQVMNYSGEQQVSIMEWAQKLRNVVELHGIRCDIVGRKYNGN